MNKALITMDDWSGGNTLNQQVGGKTNSFRSFGLDCVKRPGSILPSAAFQNITGGAGNFLDAMYGVTDGITYFCDGIKIYTLSGANAVTATRTIGAIGLREYLGYMYYPNGTQIGRYNMGTPAYVDNWNTGLSSTDHQMEISADNFLYFTNGQTLARYDGSSYSANVLDFQVGWSSVCLANFGIPYLAIGVNFPGSLGSTDCKVLLWDRTSTSWNDEIAIPELKIWAMCSYKGGLWVWAGQAQISLYYIPLGSRTATKVFTFENNVPSSYSPSVFPNSVTVREGRIWFGYTAAPAASTQCLPGVYSFNPNPKNLQMQGEFLQSTISYTDTNTCTVSMCRNLPNANNSTVYVSGMATPFLFCSTSNVNYLNPFQSSVGYTNLESITYEAPPGTKLYIDGFGIDTNKKPAGDMTLEFMIDDSGTWITVFNSTPSSSIGVFKKYQVEAFKISIRLSISGVSGLAVYSLNRAYAVGKLIADPR